LNLFTVFIFALFTPLLNLILFTFQSLALVTILHFLGAFDESSTSNTPLYMAIVLFLLSVSWTWGVAKNVTVAIVSGAVGTWWFTPVDASSFCSGAVTGSIRRATTYSFGSICFGSLVVTVLNVVNDSLIRLRQSKHSLLLYCVVQCLLEILERIAEYFNKWAMIYVGLYGTFQFLK
jgi:Plasma-membrane choline transporter.